MKEIIELLEDAKTHVSDDHVCCPKTLKHRIDQALTLLKQPKCKTCGGWGFMLEDCPQAELKVPCPDCQQPPAGEWTKEYREEFKPFIEGCRWNINCGDAFRETLDRLDTSEAELKDIKLELSTPETCGLQNEPLYKWAATIVCAKNELKAKLDTSEAINKELLKALEISQVIFQLIFEDQARPRHIRSNYKARCRDAISMIEAAISKANDTGSNGAKG